jgi:hypothetical protein
MATLHTTDHEVIRRWAEERGAKPARVKGTGGKDDPGLIRLDFPGYSGEDTLEPISWDDWFRKFAESDLVFIYQETTASGEPSNFNKLVKRETLEEELGKSVEDDGKKRERKSRGESATR